MPVFVDVHLFLGCLTVYGAYLNASPEAESCFNDLWFRVLTDSTSVASHGPLNSSSLAAQRYQALSSINQNLHGTKSGLIENHHSRRRHSIDLGIENTATSSSSRNSDFDNALCQASSCRSSTSDTEFWNYFQSPTMDVPPVTELPSPDRQV